MKVSMFVLLLAGSLAVAPTVQACSNCPKHKHPAASAPAAKNTAAPVKQDANATTTADNTDPDAASILPPSQDDAASNNGSAAS